MGINIITEKYWT